MNTNLEQLEKQIVKANDAYRSGSPIMSDVEYDHLLEQLKQVDPQNPLLCKAVIESKPQTRKAKLPIPMYSLNKVKSFIELLNWTKLKNLTPKDIMVITPKFDGISLVVDEKYQECWTRGDGVEGQESSKHFNKIIGRQIEESVKMISFGEAIMSTPNFKEFDKEFATARNLVAGLFNRDDASEILRKVDYIRYGSTLHMDKVSQIDYLNEFFNVVPVPCVVCNVSELNTINFTDLFKEWGEMYSIDGLVIEVNDIQLRDQLGRETNNNPAYAIAYKDPKWAKTLTTKVKGVSWETSKDGKLKPVINIEPVNYNGVNIQNITGYNARYIIDNNIHAGATIEMTRSGDVIPKHLSTIDFNEEMTWRIADEISLCPCCGSPTLWDSNMVEMLCTNPKCKDREINSLVHFFNTLGVEEFGKPSIQQLYEEGFENIFHILFIEKEELVNIPGWGDKSAQTLLDQFEKVLTTPIPLARFLHALNVFEGKLGEKDCQLIFDRLDEKDVNRMVFKHSFVDNDIQTLTRIKGIGEITANDFLRGLIRLNKYENDLNFTLDDRIIPFFIKNERTGNPEGKFKGISICMTGFRDKELEELVVKEGGSIASGVSKNLTYLLVKDANSTSSKMEKAKKLGVEVLTKEQFLNSTCTACPQKDCQYRFDPYNENGDCLAVK